jgi:flagellar hook-associated protein 2
MPTSSISGLASGLDTAGIIDQLMQLEAISQNRLKVQQSTQKTVLSALQALNTDLASLATKAEALAKPETWQTLKATSTSTAITATAGAGATATSFDVTVKKLASAAQTLYSGAYASNANVVTGTVDLTDAAGNSHQISTGTGSLADLTKGINDAKVGVTATMVQTSAGLYRLQLTADKTGEGAYDLALSNVNLTVASSTKGVNAEISIGSLGLTASSSTNTFTDLAPGVTLTLGPGTKVGDASTISVAQDSSGVKANVKGLVDQVNALLTKIDSQTANSSGGTTTAGVLAGDSTARSLRSAMVDTVFGSGGTTSMASIGIQTDRYGKLVFDEAKFDAAYTADPTGVMKQFTAADTSADPNVAHPDGWAALVQKVAKNASDPYAGTITSAVKGRQTTIDRLGDDITDWDDRLALRRTSLTRQYTALETALSSLQSQGNWLAGQLASLPTSSSS